MPSLIGTAPNQVPVNAMLGSAAYQDVNNFAVETKASSDNSDFAASTKFVNNLNATNNEILTTTGGVGTAYILTPTVPLAGYVAGQRFTVKFHVACGSSPAINVSGLGAVSILMKNAGGGAGSPGPSVIPANTTSVIRYNGTAFELEESFPATASEAAAGTNTFNFLSPSGLRSALNASGTAPIYACRAWVNFNGIGTVVIRGSGNVTSITDNGTGNYTVNFTTGMQDSNYCVTGTCGGNYTAYSNLVLGLPAWGQYDFSGVQVVTTVGGSSYNLDAPFVSVAIFR